MSDSSEINWPWQWTMITSLVHSRSRVRLGEAGFSGIELSLFETSSNGGERFGKVSHTAPGMEREILWRSLRAGGDADCRRYNFWGTIAVTEVTDFEAPLLVQSRGCYKRWSYWRR